MTGAFEALGDPVRRHVLELLAAGERSAGEVVAALQTRAPISQPLDAPATEVARGRRTGSTTTGQPDRPAADRRRPA